MAKHKKNNLVPRVHEIVKLHQFLYCESKANKSTSQGSRGTRKFAKEGKLYGKVSPPFRYNLSDNFATSLVY